MKQNAIVIKVLDEKWAEVEVRRSSACGEACASCSGGCAKRVLHVTAFNKAGAKPGDSVIIESETSRIVSLAFLVYILPLVVFLAAYLAASSLNLSESACILISVGAFILGCISVVLINRWIRRDKKMHFEIISVS